MNIPKLTKDLAVIQKLSDLPNTADGLSAAALKAKFDEGSLTIQTWLNETLLPALKAENIPFAGSEQLDAEDVQTAVELIFAQIRDAGSGAIVNGSVTKTKLAEELLARVFGGRPWISLEKPTAACCPETEFPVGQLWLKPGFKVENALQNSWTTTACTLRTEDNALTVTGTGAVAEVDAVQILTDVGRKGDRVIALFDIRDRDSELVSVTAKLGSAEVDAGSGVCEAVLESGTLQLTFRGVWPSASLAKGSFTVGNLAVVNIDSILRQTADGQEMSDWIGYLRGLLPLNSHYDPRAMYIQTTAGIWQQIHWECLPVAQGGTGLSAAAAGELLYGTGENRLEALPAGKENSLLQMTDGAPQWSAPAEAAARCGFASIAEGQYVGTALSGTVELPAQPKVLWLRTADGVQQFFQGTAVEGTYKGAYTVPYVGTEEQEATYTAGVTLEGTQLQFWFRQPEIPKDGTWVRGDAVHLNETGKTYSWTAIY